MDDKVFIVKSSMPKIEDYMEKIKPLWDTRWLTNFGSLHNELENKLQKFFNVKHCKLFVNGHLSLETAIEALGLTGEVITTPFTFASTTNAIIRKGLTPVFCDIDKDTYTIDVSKIEKLITDKTSAILAVHVYGNPCNVEAIDKIAKKHNLKVIYDAAHCFDAEFNGKSLVSYGDISMISFHATKVFHTIEGGALITNNDRLAEKISKYRNFGLDSEVIGSNLKMNEFCAAMGLCLLDRMSDIREKRKNIVDKYNSCLENNNKLKLLTNIKGLKRNNIYYPILCESEQLREKIEKNLNDINVFPRRYFYPLTSDIVYKGKICTTPIANDITKRVLCLPLYEELPIETVIKICNSINNTCLK